MTAYSEWHHWKLWLGNSAPSPRESLSVCWCLNECLKSQIPQPHTSTEHGPCFLPTERIQTSPTQAEFPEPRCFSTAKGERCGKPFVASCGITVCRQSKNCAEHQIFIYKRSSKSTVTEAQHRQRKAPAPWHFCSASYPTLYRWLHNRKMIPLFSLQNWNI